VRIPYNLQDKRPNAANFPKLRDLTHKLCSRASLLPATAKNLATPARQGRQELLAMGRLTLATLRTLRSSPAR
jgi:hypothetical protein